MATKKKETFEQSMTRLEEIVQRLENGKCSLAETLADYDEGMKLASALEQQLKGARQQLTILRNGQEVSVEEEQIGEEQS